MPQNDMTIDISNDLEHRIEKAMLNISYNNNYPHFYLPRHPLANNNGMVSLSRHVASVHLLKRWITADEVVIIKNGDLEDVRLENLEIVSRSDLLKRISPCSLNQVECVCERCGETFTDCPSHAVRRRYCTPECAQKARRKFDISKEELAQLVWEFPKTKIAEWYGVSDKAIAKRCKIFGIESPGRGYWRKAETGTLAPYT
ncbi:MAG: hypothetical protein U9Q82_04525 [Chloroflexota bacterium]|nr:hypothetical protein [Chloroflexota bacterium]